VLDQKGRALLIRRLVRVVAFTAALALADPARADSFRWPQPGGPGTPVVLTYSFANLFDGFRLAFSPSELRGATEEAFGLWSRYAPLNFYERMDSGPPPSDWEYARASYPDIRIGSHAIDGDGVLAHAFLPFDTVRSGLAGDIHVNTAAAWTWSIGAGFPSIDFLEVITHEIGHALGLGHEMYADAIMSPFHGFRFHGLGTGFLFPSDIRAIRAIYGAGVGSVHPVPEPSPVFLLVTGGLALGWREVRFTLRRISFYRLGLSRSSPARNL
jgi:matrixin